MNRKDKAIQLFKEGYNCSQAVVLAFADLLPLEEEMLSKISCSFGGGFGRMREVCGSVSGMTLVCGMLYGYSGTGEGGEKKEQYTRIQNLLREFEQQNGSIVCRELLGLSERHSDSHPTERSGQFYQKRPCAQLVGEAAAILEAFLDKNPVG